MTFLPKSAPSGTVAVAMPPTASTVFKTAQVGVEHSNET